MLMINIYNCQLFFCLVADNRMLSPTVLNSAETYLSILSGRAKVQENTSETLPFGTFI